MSFPICSSNPIHETAVEKCWQPAKANRSRGFPGTTFQKQNANCHYSKRAVCDTCHQARVNCSRGFPCTTCQKQNASCHYSKRVACDTCHQAKVKCPGGFPCTACQKRNESWPACDTCRKAKAKCSRGFPCTTCRKRNANCHYSERRRKSPSSVMKEVTVQETSSAPALFESNLSILPSGQPNLQDPGMMGHTGDAIHPNYLMEEPQLSGEKFMYDSELPYPYVGVNRDSTARCFQELPTADQKYSYHILSTYEN
ncbi:hypothetical protein TSTA_084490 [Talaromyces stipitatus ATCC 10500]|uniref:Zn(2)-C6 fungal-type domain-containing protein n=1 Tax=Talaromyces stipitatus (strain ATCC 10500 / CBS 375.48 / QM 6759 / NRRL 1006) TaxID=441959 RepID=B8M0C1_TALSN|nr:uncharacterized protein TSTA_084490 [Talaromyces stipitatus ATCC 10500]EED21218.1 hypothetical protein TSTA_084490 [Talaromyces stipitatus ATCC 10500]